MIRSTTAKNHLASAGLVSVMALAVAGSAAAVFVMDSEHKQTQAALAPVATQDRAAVLAVAAGRAEKSCQALRDDLRPACHTVREIRANSAVSFLPQ